MFSLTPLSEDEVRSFVSRQSRSSLSYSEVGATASSPPRHYNVDHARIQLGQGEAVWNRAVEAVQAWQMFNIPWLTSPAPRGRSRWRRRSRTAGARSDSPLSGTVKTTPSGTTSWHFPAQGRSWPSWDIRSRARCNAGLPLPRRSRCWPLSVHYDGEPGPALQSTRWIGRQAVGPST